MKLLSRVRLLATPWTAAHQAPPSMEFSRQEYWSGVPSPSPQITPRSLQTSSSAEFGFRESTTSQHTRLYWRGSTRVPPSSRGAPFPPHSSRATPNPQPSTAACGAGRDGRGDSPQGAHCRVPTLGCYHILTASIEPSAFQALFPFLILSFLVNTMGIKNQLQSCNED